MAEELDPSMAALADAPLDSEQRRAVQALWNELVSVRAQNRELQEKIRCHEEAPDDMEAVLLNRFDFNREVARMLAFDERYGGVSSVLYFDFDGIDEVVKALGAQASGVLFQKIVSVLTRGVRKSDIVGRLASDEFGAFLVRCDKDNAWKKAGILAKELKDSFAEIEGGSLDIKVSYGAYTFSDNDEDPAVGIKGAAKNLTRITV